MKNKYPDNTIKVSVIVPCYNDGAFLNGAIQSVLQSTYERFEIIITNDGSTDSSTTETLRDIEEKLRHDKDKRIRIIHQDNLGLAHARNSAIRVAKGEYILPLDADNRIRPHYLENAVEILDNNPEIGVVYAYAKRFGEDEKIWEFPVFYPRRLLLGNFVEACSVFRKRIWEECNGYDTDMGIMGYEDWDLWICAMKNGWKFHLIKEVMFDYCVHQGSMINGCNIPENNRYLIRYICNKHRDMYVKNLEFVMSEKNVETLELTNRLETLRKESDTHIKNLEELIYNIYKSRGWKALSVCYQIRDWIIPLNSIRRDIVKIFFDTIKNTKETRSKKNIIAKIKQKIISMFTRENSYRAWIKKYEPSSADIRRLTNEVNSLQYQPKISIITPVYDTDENLLVEMIESVLSQIYTNWELCIADGGSFLRHVQEVLQRYSKKDSRIRVKFMPKNKGISGNSDEALALATGEFVGFLDHDDRLSPNSLYEIVTLLNINPEIDLVYSDEDKISIKGQRFEPHFKPNWSPDTFLSHNYLCHFTVIRKKIVDEIGGFRDGYEGSQDYDLFLRVVEKTQRIEHMPKVLYHWRQHEGSTSGNQKAKMYAYESAKKALKDHIQRMAISGEIIDGNFLSSYRVKYHIEGYPSVSIIIPTRDKVETIRNCIDSVLRKSSYKNYKIFIVDNQSKEDGTFQYYKEIRNEYRIEILNYDQPFNFAAINNYAVYQVSSEYIIFLNNDTEIISPDWIENMLEFAQRKDVGAVGALLYYPNNTIQHGGVILGINGVAAHAHLGFSGNSMGYFGRLKIIQNLSAVTAACLMCKKKIYSEVGGFDEYYSHAFNDVDFCLKIRERGYLIVYTPYTELYHHESLSRGLEDSPGKKTRFKKEIEYFQRKWEKVLANGDPYYNPNLTLKREDFSIRV